MDHGKGLKNRGTFASEASGPQKLEKLHLGGNLNFFGYGVFTIPSGMFQSDQLIANKIYANEHSGSE